MGDSSHVKICALAGKGGAGKDTFYEHVLQPRGFIRLQMTLYRKIWFVSTGQATWEEVFYTKPPRVRKLMQEDITELRYEFDEEIWLRVLQNQIRALDEIMCVQADRIAVTDMRFLAEIRGVKHMGGKILHLKAADEQPTSPPSGAATAPRSSSTARRCWSCATPISIIPSRASGSSSRMARRYCMPGGGCDGTHGREGGGARCDVRADERSAGQH